MAENLVVPAIIIAALAVFCSNEGAAAMNWIVQYKRKVLVSVAVTVLIVAWTAMSDHNPFATWR